MSQKPVVMVEDITKTALEERRPGCAKGLMHEDEPVLTAMYRVQPRSGVPTHLGCAGLRSVHRRFDQRDTRRRRSR